MKAYPPALGLIELDSIAIGIFAGDAMVKRAPVEPTYVGTVHPGKYLVLVAGDVASVEEAMAAGTDLAADHLLDRIFLPDADQKVHSALRRHSRGPVRGEALGVVETSTAAAILGAADRGVKGARVEISELRLADALGGKAYCCFQGDVADVEASVELAVAPLSDPGQLVANVVIPHLHDEIRHNLDADPRFTPRIRVAVDTGGGS